jgi:pyruvate-ferredoxin/flavodoxin oxidoreductase
MANAVSDIGQRRRHALASADKHGAPPSGGEPIDQAWLRRVTQLLAAQGPALALREGHGRARPLEHGHDQLHRLHVGLGLHLPLQPLPVPVDEPPVPGLAVDGDGHLRGAHGQDGGRLQGHAQAELELAGGTTRSQARPLLHLLRLAAVHDEEWELCPPVVAVGGDGAMYDIGFQNLSRAMMSGKPIKVVVVDTQVYSNTGGQACTSGSSARSPTWPSTARRRRASRRSARRSA